MAPSPAHNPQQHETCSPAVSLSQLDAEVHVWRGDAEELAPEEESFEVTLSPAEKARAAQMTDPNARRSFVLRRGFLRSLISRYMHLPASGLVLAPNAERKLALSGHDDLDFSVASSHDVTLVAIARNRRVGVDLEYVHVDFDYWALAEYWFAPAENAYLSRLSPRDSKHAFFCYWTRKEAFAKATGRKFDKPSMVEVPLVECGPISATRNGRREELPNWRLADLSMGSSFSAALAVEGQHWIPRCMWSSEDVAKV